MLRLFALPCFRFSIMMICVWWSELQRGVGVPTLNEQSNAIREENISVAYICSQRFFSIKKKKRYFKIFFFLFFICMRLKQNHGEGLSQRGAICFPQISFQKIVKKKRKRLQGGGRGGGDSRVYRQRERKRGERPRRCNYQERSLRDQLHFKGGRPPRPVLDTAWSLSVVRVGKHEQITGLIIAARSEEVSTLCLPSCFLDSQTGPFAWKECTQPAHSAVCHTCMSSLASRQIVV